MAPNEQDDDVQQQRVLSPTTMQALGEAQARLHREYFSLPRTAAGQIPVASLRRMLIEMVPETAARLAIPLSYAQDQGTDIVDHLFADGPYCFIEVGRLSALIRHHLLAYSRTLSRWDGWEPLVLHGSAHDNQWVLPWLRRSDNVVACDFVGAVFQPRTRGRATRNYGLFLAKATAIHHSLAKYYGDDYRGKRLFILGDDTRPVERWLYNDDGAITSQV